MAAIVTSVIGATTFGAFADFVNIRVRPTASSCFGHWTCGRADLSTRRFFDLGRSHSLGDTSGWLIVTLEGIAPLAVRTEAVAVAMGRSDGWTDLAGNFQMDWEFDYAPDGNIALTGELGLDVQREFTMGLAFGNTQHRAVTTLFQELGVPFEEQHKRILVDFTNEYSHRKTTGKETRNRFSILQERERMKPTQQLHDLEQSRWLDNITRGLL